MCNSTDASEEESNVRNVKVAATQMSCTESIEENIAKADVLVRKPLLRVLRLSCCKSCLKPHISVKKKI